MWDDPRQLNAAALWVALITAALLAWGGLAWLARQPAFAFRDVIVRGPLERTNAAHLEAVIRDELSGTFFTMSLERARASLSRVPWVRNVALRRHWPQRLEVTVEEHAPLARWNDTALVNAQGEVFAADYAGELPSFSGADGSATEVAGRYREWSEALAPLALSVREVKLSPRGGWQLKANGESGPLDIELGREEPSARLARFVAVWGRTVEALAKAGTRIGHVDLRYRNGFAARVPGFKERPQKKGAAQAREQGPRARVAPGDVHGDASGDARGAQTRTQTGTQMTWRASDVSRLTLMSSAARRQTKWNRGGSNLAGRAGAMRPTHDAAHAPVGLMRPRPRDSGENARPAMSEPRDVSEW